MLNKFAQELREAREKSGISPQQIAVKTRIDMKFIEAIERGDFHFLPDLYVKAFLKQYAKVIGLDEDEIAEKYVVAKEGKVIESESETDEETKSDKDDEQKSEPPKPKVTTFKDDEKKKEEKPVRKNQNYVIFGTIAGVFILIFLVYFLFIKNGSNIVVEEKPYDQVIKENTSRYVEEKPERKVDNQKTEQSVLEQLTLNITNTDSTDSAWVLVIYDDTRQEDFMLFPHRSKIIKTNNNFKLILGNSGVIKLELNDVKLNFNGKRRAVRYLKIDKNGLERLNSSPKLNRE